LAMLFVPTLMLPKFRPVGLKVIGATPVPLKLTSWGEAAALSTTVISPEKTLGRAGLKLTLMVQVPDGCTTLPAQLSDSVKPPLATMLLTDTGVPPAFVKVTGT